MKSVSSSIFNKISKSWSLVFIYILVMTSGFTGLVYQVLWQKYLAMFLGSHASATSLILTCFFLFLSIGYFLIGQVTRWNQNRLVLYAWLELGIGIYALVSPDFFSWLKNIYWLHFPTQHLYLSGFILTSLCIGVPTLLMGGTIPILTEGLSSGFGESHKVHARVYSSNTLGAFLGAVLCSFIFIEKYGLPLTLTGAGVANILVFLSALSLARFSGRNFSGPPRTIELIKSNDKNLKWKLYLVSFLSGFYVFSLENILIRMTGISLGSSVYSYGLIVAGFILAIAIGSSLAEKFDSDRKPYVLILTLALTWIMTTVLYFLIPEWPDFFLRVRLVFAPLPINFDLYLTTLLVLMVLILLLPVGLMGMNLPLLFGYLRSHSPSLSTLVGRLYAANCIGSVLGASLGGYLLFSWLNSAQIFRFNLALIALSGFFLISLDRQNSQNLISFRSWKKQILLVSFFVFFMLSFFLSPWPHDRFIPTRLFIAHPYSQPLVSAKEYIHQVAYPPFKTLFFHDDPNTSVSVIQTLPKSTSAQGKSNHQKKVELLVNAKADASYPDDALTRALLPILTTTLAEKVHHIFIVGLGPGLSTAITTHLSEVKHVEIAEISEGVRQALPHFKEYNLGLENRKNKYSLYIGDAFQTLKSTTKKYDVILSEPSNPWIAGVDKLFTADFFSIVSDRLTDQGVFGQWFPVSAVNTANFLLILNTIKSVFPFVTAWNSGGGAIALIASRQPLVTKPDVITRRFQEHAVFLKPYQITFPTTLLGLQLLPPWTIAGLTANTPFLHTLEFPTLTYSAARSIFGGESARIDTILSEKILRPVPISEPQAHLLIDQWPQPWPQESLQELNNFYVNLGRYTAHLPSWRWVYEMQIQHGRHNKEKPASKALAWMVAVMGQGPLPESSHPEDPTFKTRNLLLAYQRAKLNYLQPKADILLSQWDWNCRSELCARTADQLLRELQPLKELKNRPLPQFESEKDRSTLFTELKTLWSGSIQQ